MNPRVMQLKQSSSVSISDGGMYQCRAKRGNYYSEYSNEVKITVKGQCSLTFYTFFNGRQLYVFVINMIITVIQ